MTDCGCAPPDAAGGRPRCPDCSGQGAAVEIRAVKALLVDHALARWNPAAFFFCASPSCDIVYFAADGQRFVTADLRVPVWHKQPFGNRTVCYCFGENEADIRREVVRDGSSAAVERVRGHIAAKRCACEVRNPRGVCCLGDVTAAVARATARAAT